MRISDWSSDVCSSDLEERTAVARQLLGRQRTRRSVEALVHPAVVGRQQCEVRLQTQPPGRLLAAHIVAPQRRSIQRPAPEGGPKRPRLVGLIPWPQNGSSWAKRGFAMATTLRSSGIGIVFCMLASTCALR